MQKYLLYLILILLPFKLLLKNNPETTSVIEKKTSGLYELYTEMQLENKVDFDAFEKALKGYQNIETDKKDIITVIDFNKPSTAERLHVLDLNERKLLYSSVVSHGQNSGSNYAKVFSNKVGSYQSSLGFYKTENTYIGKNGYSLVLNGLEEGFNDKAKERAIVVHGAPYSNPSVIPSMGRLGRSQGCPALPQAITKDIIDAIKGGTLLYIHANNEEYLSKSPILNSGQKPA